MLPLSTFKKSKKSRNFSSFSKKILKGRQCMLPFYFCRSKIINLIPKTSFTTLWRSCGICMKFNTISQTSIILALITFFNGTLHFLQRLDKIVTKFCTKKCLNTHFSALLSLTIVYPVRPSSVG